MPKWIRVLSLSVILIQIVLLSPLWEMQEIDNNSIYNTYDERPKVKNVKKIEVGEDLVARNETYYYDWQFQLPIGYNDTTIMVYYYLERNFVSGNVSTTMVIVNSSKDSDIPLSMNIYQETSYSLIHFYNDSDPFFTEVSCKGSTDGYLDFTLLIHFNNIRVELGKYLMTFKVLDSEGGLMSTRQDQLLLTTFTKFVLVKTLVNTPHEEKEWTNLSSLLPSTLAPSDTITIIGYLTDKLTGETIAQSSYTQDYTTTVVMGSTTSTRNSTFFNGSSKFHQEVGLQNDLGQMINTIQIPSVNFQGNVSITHEFRVPIDWVNETPTDFLEIKSEELLIPCDYDVVGEGEDLPANVWYGEFLRAEIRLRPVKKYNRSVEIKPTILVPNVVVRCFWHENTTSLVTKTLQWNRNKNTININHGLFGYYPSYLPYGLYSINLSWGDNTPIYESPESENTVKYELKLIEDYQIVLLTTENKRIENVTITNKFDPVEFQLKLVSKTTGVSVQDTSFWIGYDEDTKWRPTLEGSEYQFDQTLDIQGNETTLWTWVEFRNGTIIKLGTGIQVYYRPTHTSKTTSEDIGLPYLDMMLLMVLTMGFLYTKRRMN